MKSKYFIVIIIPFFIFCVGCHSFENAIQVEINLEYSENTIPSILFETKPGCSKTNFEFTDIYFQYNTLNDNCFIASDYNEYENTIKKYFKMDYFKNITPEYFNNNILIIVILSANDGDYYKNGRFERGHNNKYIFKIDLWDNGKPFIFRNKCTYFEAYIINIEKN
jgi:hypothetical protein